MRGDKPNWKRSRETLRRVWPAAALLVAVALAGIGGFSRSRRSGALLGLSPDPWGWPSAHHQGSCT